MNETLESADINRIQRIIPHRYPFLLVDKVIEIDGYASAIGVKNVTMNEPQFTGHFPSKPVMPGVLMIEAMAQTAGVMVGVALGLEDTNTMIYFMSIEKSKFRRMVVPGDRLEMRLTTLRGKPGGKIWKFSGVASVDGEMACEVEFMAMLEQPATEA
ncbi:3-hydroxyacyl-ACP dehydratase FabZ [Pseudooceanicola algae]|uniref:3-hydroxyacyl-[acyl-carrier-protein] dehydratase FabZ n=1 Tax=Pseudooceanicola algae TaxID=1537215 RepID=A0A418SE64_9RHOB|nr:3-hydroxyacyl-ACP dehydratase FabZ [Pseudooceanicola algae]QPM89509.1 3-hydroxyacyl-[acyl-carrier-protein] dehydratase FabZ [Pseudooceanicola algae]